MILESFRNIFKIPELRIKILYTAFFLIIFRIGTHIPIPGIDLSQLKMMVDSSQMPGGSVGGYLNLLSSIMGGSLGNCAIFALGVMPYISASIIFSLLTKVIPSLEAIAKEGPSGQRKINEYTRWATLPLCIIQSAMLVKLFKMGSGNIALVGVDAGLMFDIVAILSLTTGTMFLMWLGEQITEYGVGNGMSILIMAGIVSNIPYQTRMMLADSETGDGLRVFIILILLFVLIIAAVIYITFGQRKITIQQAKHVKGTKVYGGQKHFLPLKVNQAGVMPVIFTSSLLIFPRLFMGNSNWFTPGTFLYVLIYILMIYFFSYFWTSLMFQPTEMANNLKEHGSFIPGIRPGPKTAEYLEKVMVHITFVGAAFLCVIALFPMFVVSSMDLRQAAQISFVYNLGGTTILIMVGVVLDLVQKMDSQLLMRNYEGFTKGGRSRGR